MQRQLLIALFTITTLALSAQSPLRSRNMRFEQKPMPRNKVAFTGTEPMAQGAINENLPVLNRSTNEQTIGETVYDLQSNSSVPNRIFKRDDGSLLATWTYGNTAPGYAERGTGYNTADGATLTWGPSPTQRIEDERTGWPNVVALADGTPVVASHASSNNSIKISKFVNGAWQYSSVTTAVPSGILWPRMAVGGPDGNTLHLIAIQYPTTTNNVAYDGVIGHLLYFRSTDGGATWDKSDIKLPQLDSNYYVRMDADSYALDANGETVAVAFFGDWGDIKVSKSDDNGETWTTWTVNDFPIDKYVNDQGYTTADIPVDPNAPDTLAIFSSDNAGDVLVDNDGKVHAWFGEMYIADTDLTDGNSSYYPASSGLRYWNEDMGENTTTYAVEGVLDVNENDTLDVATIDNIALYFASLTAFPSAGVDQAGRIYVAYSSLMENLINTAATPDPQHNRHIHLVYSEDNGETWSDPYDVITDGYIIEPDLLELYETVFPAIARNVDYKIDLIYQTDFEPGLAVRGDEDAPGTNYINYNGIDVADLGIVNNTNVVNPSELSFTISPNPVYEGMTQLVYETATVENVSIQVTNAIGQTVKRVNLSQQSIGKHGYLLNTAEMSSGLYIVTLKVGEYMASSKMVVR